MKEAKVFSQYSIIKEAMESLFNTSSQNLLPAFFILVFVSFFLFWLWMFFRILREILKTTIKAARYAPQMALFTFRFIGSIPYATGATFRFIRIYPSVLALVASNLLPLLGVFFFQWDVFSILILYWLESAVVGFYTVLKLPKASAVSTPEEINELRGYRINAKSAAASLKEGTLTRFFIQQYGVFMGGHALFLGVFMFALISSKIYIPPQFGSTVIISILGSAAALFTSHGVSYAVNFVGKQEFLSISPAGQLMQPYKRIGVMHLTIVLGGMFAFLFHSTTAFLAVLILSKIALDILYHLKERGALPAWLMSGPRGRIIVAGSFKRSKDNTAVG